MTSDDNADRVRANTSEEVNQTLDQEMRMHVRAYENAGAEKISARIEELEREWDMERVLETNASALALTGLALGVTHNKKWLIVPGVVLSFLFQHAVQGWCPPVPVFRRLGVRTREEIDRERYALKVLRGDFENAASAEASADAALNAAKA